MKMYGMWMKSVFAFLCLCAGLWLSNLSAEQEAAKTPIKAVIFGFGNVMARMDNTSLQVFLMDTFNISADEATRVVKEQKAIKTDKAAEKNFWINYGYAHGVGLSEEWFERMARVQAESYEEIPNMKKLVKELQKLGFRTALFSNISPFQAQVIGKFGYYELFDPILLSYETGAEEPDPKAYKLLQEKIHLHPSAILLIDSNPEFVEGANAAGMETITFYNPDLLRLSLRQKGIMVSEK